MTVSSFVEELFGGMEIGSRSDNADNKTRGRVVDVLGPTRSGKTELIYHILEAHILPKVRQHIAFLIIAGI